MALPALRAITPLALAACFFWLGCDSGEPTTRRTSFPLNPDTVDFNQIQSLDYADYVQPLLAYRNVFGVPGEEPEDRLEAYAWDVLFIDRHPSSATVIPFDANESLLVRCAEGNCIAPTGTVPIPFPNVDELETDEIAFLRRWVEDGARNENGRIPFADAEVLLFVCNQLANRVSIIDAERMQVIRNVYFAELGEPGGPMGALPHHTAVEPDGRAWYVTLIAGSDGGSVLKLSGDLRVDPADPAYVLDREVSPAFQTPGMLALHAPTRQLAVGRSFSADGSERVALFDTETMTFEEIEAPSTAHPHAIALSTNGAFLLTASLANNPPSLTVYRTARAGLDLELVDQIFFPGESLAFVQYAVSRDGETLALTSQTSNELLLLQLNPTTGELALLDRVDVGLEPWHPVFSPDGATVYVPNRLSHDISVVNVVSGTVSSTIRNPTGGPAIFSEPHGSAISADGSILFIANRNLNFGLWTPPYPTRTPGGSPLPNTEFGNVVAINIANNQVVAVTQTGKWASGMSIYDPR